MAATDHAYYSNSSNWGENQYVSMTDIINNFYLFYVGDSKIINDVDRHDIIFHAKRGLQEIHYDALKEIKAIEMEMPDTLQIVVPHDFVGLARISWVDDVGKLRPMINGKYTTVVDKAFLQDDQGNILFDGAGSALTGTPLMDIRNMQNVDDGVTILESNTDDYVGGRFGMDTANASANGTYNFDKALGVIRFSSDVATKLIVVEYFSDGITNIDETAIKVHKMAEDFLYKYIAHEIIRHKFGVQEYIVRRMKKETFAALNNTKIRMSDVHPLDIIQASRGGQKWIK